MGFGYTKNAVKIPHGSKGWLPIVRRDNRRNSAEQESHQCDSETKIVTGPLRQGAVAQPTKKPQETSGRERDREFAELGEVPGCQNRCEQPTQNSATCRAQIESR